LSGLGIDFVNPWATPSFLEQSNDFVVRGVINRSFFCFH
uniref:Radical SAM protein n=1 Tax=Haemonchus placei TaxID=6290 RepID=A0A158QNI6_HAEPC